MTEGSEHIVHADGHAVRSIWRRLCLLIGSISLIIGMIGIIVPLLPTTPFLLLSAVCYGRSSRRLYSWLTQNRLFGRYIRRYREGKGVSVRMKAVTIALVWLTILSSSFCVVDSFFVRIVLLLIAAGVTIHILLLRTFRHADIACAVEESCCEESTEDG